MKREGFIITYYKSSIGSQALLEKSIDAISKENYYLVVASHTPLSIELQEKCDFYIYQEQDIVDNRKWSHGVAENNLIEMALHHLKFKDINWTYKVCYDITINDFSIFKEWNKGYRYNFVSCQWGTHIISSNSFFANVDFVLSNIKFYHSIEEMFKVSTYLEDCWEKDIFSKRVNHQIFTYPSKEDFFGPNNKMDEIALDYNKLDFSYNPAERRFYINNIGPDINAELKIVDYYTDLLVYYTTNHIQAANTSLWIMSPYYSNMDKCQNGFYMEIEINGLIIRRNFGIRDFDDKHSNSKKYKLLKDLQFGKFIAGEI